MGREFDPDWFFCAEDSTNLSNGLRWLGVRAGCDSSGFCPSATRDALRRSSLDPISANEAACWRFDPTEAIMAFGHASDVRFLYASDAWRHHIRRNILLREIVEKLWPDSPMWGFFAKWIQEHGQRCERKAVKRAERAYELGYRFRGRKPLRRYLRASEREALRRARRRFRKARGWE